jgi:hypothetical protein
LGILARLAQLVSKLFKVAEDGELGLQLGDGLGCDGTISDLLLGLFQLGTPGLVEVTVFVIVEQRGQLLLLLQSAAPGDDALLGQPRFEPFATAPQRAIDRGGRRGEPALQYLQREAHVVSPLVVAKIVEVAHLVAHVLGDRGIELRFEVRELVLDRVRLALREERRAVELS